jgi:hypothetical protein
MLASSSASSSSRTAACPWPGSRATGREPRSAAGVCRRRSPTWPAPGPAEAGAGAGDVLVVDDVHIEIGARNPATVAPTQGSSAYRQVGRRRWSRCPRQPAGAPLRLRAAGEQPPDVEPATVPCTPRKPHATQPPDDFVGALEYGPG